MNEVSRAAIIAATNPRPETSTPGDPDLDSETSMGACQPCPVPSANRVAQNKRSGGVPRAPPLPIPLAVPAKLAHSVGEAASISGISRSMLYRYIAAGLLPLRKAGRRSLILADDLRKFLRSLPRLSAGGGTP
jgi:excisionase family DNA binding protein